jgi:hypothetical protein
VRVQQPQQIIAVRRVLEERKDTLFSIRSQNQTVEEDALLDVDIFDCLSIYLMILEPERAASDKQSSLLRTWR